MYPELFEIPIIHATVKSYGLMMVVGFLVAVFVIRHLSRNFTSNPEYITNAALYSLIAGVVGARIFYVLHYWEQFRYHPLSVFAVWKGGLELIGGVVLAITVIYLYLWYHKLPIRRYLDILAIGLMFALIFGRIGCFLNGCCFGKPTDLPWAVCFPYGSPSYRSQVFSDPDRDRHEPRLEIPIEFFGYKDETGAWNPGLKPFDLLTEKQRVLVAAGPYHALRVHPTQLYSSANAVLCALILFLFWRRSQKTAKAQKLLTKPGSTFALMFTIYGLTRFCLEYLRDDNPFEHAWWTIYQGGTISQNVCIYLILLGVVLMAVFGKMKPDNVNLHSKQAESAS
jgi:phosphatidylglycerol:prolipoprotein diacylglycerol transferase